MRIALLQQVPVIRVQIAHLCLFVLRQTRVSHGAILVPVLRPACKVIRYTAYDAETAESETSGEAGGVEWFLLLEEDPDGDDAADVAESNLVVMLDLIKE